MTAPGECYTSTSGARNPFVANDTEGATLDPILRLGRKGSMVQPGSQMFLSDGN